MEALIVVLLALAAIVLLEAAYWMAISLMRWTPIIVIGVLIGWLARRHGAEPLGAVGLATLSCLIMRHALGSAPHFRKTNERCHEG